MICVFERISLGSQASQTHHWTLYSCKSRQAGCPFGTSISKPNLWLLDERQTRVVLNIGLHEYICYRMWFTHMVFKLTFPQNQWQKLSKQTELSSIQLSSRLNLNTLNALHCGKTNVKGYLYKLFMQFWWRNCTPISFVLFCMCYISNNDIYHHL